MRHDLHLKENLCKTHGVSCEAENPLHLQEIRQLQCTNGTLDSDGSRPCCGNELSRGKTVSAARISCGAGNRLRCGDNCGSEDTGGGQQ